MKVLFVCRGNVGRSQMAEAFFNHYSRNHSATSAGINGLKYSQRRIGDLSEEAVRCMQEKGIDISGKTPRQLTREVADESELVVWIADRNAVPDYLLIHQEFH